MHKAPDVHRNDRYQAGRFPLLGPDSHRLDRTNLRLAHSLDDLDPLAVRKATLASLLARTAPGLQPNEHLDEEDGPFVFQHACKLGLEGIVSKRKESRYWSGRSPDFRRGPDAHRPATARKVVACARGAQRRGHRQGHHRLVRFDAGW